MTNGKHPTPGSLYDSEQVEKDRHLIAALAQKQLHDIHEFLYESEKELDRRKRQRQFFIWSITSLLALTLIAFIWALRQRSEAIKSREEIALTAKSNLIATKAYMAIEKDPTLAFRLAEQAYKVTPTPLAQQVIMSAYGEMPFYFKLKCDDPLPGGAKFSPDGKYLLTAGVLIAILWELSSMKKIIKIDAHKPFIGSVNPNLIDFSPDSKYFVTAGQDSTARLWDVSAVSTALTTSSLNTGLQGNCLAVMKHQGGVNSAMFSPDGQKILTASSDETARLWDMKGNELVVFKGHRKSLILAKFSRDIKTIITLAGDSTVRLWGTDGVVHQILLHPDNIRDVTYTPDLKNIITACTNKTIIIWDSTYRINKVLTGHTEYVRWVQVSPDNKFILSASKDNSIKLWDIQGKEIVTMRGHTAFIWSIRFSPDGKHIVTASDDGTARLWDINGTEIMLLKGHSSQILNANFSPDGKYVVTASADATARIWNIQSLENPIFKGHTAYVFDANFSPDGKSIVTAGWDYTARLWDVKGNLMTKFSNHTGYGVSIANFIHDNYFSIGSDGKARIWNINGKEILNIVCNGSYNYKISFNSDSSLLSIYSADNNSARIVDFKGNSIQKFSDSYEINFYDNNFLLQISPDSSLYFLKQQVKNDSIQYTKFRQLKLSKTVFTSAEFSSDKKWLLTSSDDSIARIWLIDNILNKKENELNPIWSFKHPSDITILKFSPDGTHILTTAQDNIGRIWKTDELINPSAKGGSASGGKLMLGHSDAITDANFSPPSTRGKYIVTGSLDFTVRVWDLEGNELQTLASHKAKIQKVKFSPDGKFILSASNDHTARLMPWRVEDVLQKINVEKVRGEVWQLGEKEKKVYGVE